jgi:hypothetical protein
VDTGFFIKYHYYIELLHHSGAYKCLFPLMWLDVIDIVVVTAYTVSDDKSALLCKRQ